MNNGSIAVAIVSRQVTLVQATRSHSSGDRSFDVQVYTPFGNGVFLASDVPARIQPSDILSTVTDDDCRSPTSGMLEVSPKTYGEFMHLSCETQKRYEKMWSSWTARMR